MAERLGPEEDYGFEYEIEVADPRIIGRADELREWIAALDRTREQFEKRLEEITRARLQDATDAGAA